MGALGEQKSGLRGCGVATVGASLVNERAPCSAVAATLLVVGVLVAPSGARAYRTLADDPTIGVPARWSGDELRWEISTAEGTDVIPTATLRTAATRAYAAWTSLACVSLRATDVGSTSERAAYGDGRSTISVVTTGWADRGLPVGRAAITDLVVERDPDGSARIVEADIYLNVESFRFVPEPAGAGEVELERVLLHEQLHQAGLAHPCGDVSAPACAAGYLESAMYPDYQAGFGLALSDDDRSGLCALYGPHDPCAACPAGTICEDGACVGCLGDAGCGLPLCDGGVCAAMCSSDESCPGGACAIAGATARTCVAAGAFGALCANGDDCASNLCFESSGIGFCTSSCADDASCGSGLVCRGVAGRRVCRSAPPTGGCSASRGSPGSLSVLGALAWIGVRAARGRRLPKGGTS